MSLNDGNWCGQNVTQSNFIMYMEIGGWWWKWYFFFFVILCCFFAIYGNHSFFGWNILICILSLNLMFLGQKKNWYDTYTIDCKGASKPNLVSKSN